MDTRREFIKKASLLSAGGGLLHVLPASIAKALAIDPVAGSTWLDAEHIVLLMQENRSFDHTYGTLQGVRGFNDPRAISLPDKNPVWLQTNKEGDTYAPFRFDIKGTKATWMNSLPHAATRNNWPRKFASCSSVHLLPRWSGKTSNPLPPLSTKSPKFWRNSQSATSFVHRACVTSSSTGISRPTHRSRPRTRGRSRSGNTRKCSRPAAPSNRPAASGPSPLLAFDANLRRLVSG